MTRILATIGLAFTLLATPSAWATDRATIEKRVAAAADLYESHGVGDLCSAVTDPAGPFMADEAYVFLYLRSGPLICHPRPDLNAMRRDRSFVSRMLENAEAHPGGAWTRYPWPHPDSYELRTKSTFCRVTGRIVICAGAYFDVGSV